MMTAPYTITLVTIVTLEPSVPLPLQVERVPCLYCMHTLYIAIGCSGNQEDSLGLDKPPTRAFHHCIKPHICNAKLTNIVLLPLRVHQCSIICRSPASGRLHTTQTAPELHWETSVPHILNETLFQILVPSLGCAPWSLASASRIVDKIMHSISLVARALTFRQHHSLSVIRASATHDTSPRTSPVWGSGRERAWTANPCDSSTDDTAVLSTHICINTTSRTLQIP